MAIFKCKMCGGSLEVTEGMTVCECEYCGTQQTLPRLDNYKRNQLFDRANYYRMNNEFDRAEVVYENILAEAPNEAEAHWGMCLCRYGIEYVVDPKTNKRIPTCHRTQFKSILDDEDYLSAVKNCDGIARAIYNSEAMHIDNVQKQILEISSKEEPFDIFICYKESDNAGNRTTDSVIAQDIYNELTNQGYKVFFARITLEDKLGSAYEPYIFAALNSSKIMLVVGTKPKHFNAVWVKNEWSRYLSLIKHGQKKTLIPCYRDITPYDLPDEFVALQSQDVSKVGYMQDLMRGIEKILGKTTSVLQLNANTSSLLKRAFMFLEDGKWDDAEEYCEKVLDIDPECAEAYLGKLMAECKVPTESDFEDANVDILPNDNYKKIMQFGDEALKERVLGYASYSVYGRGLAFMKNASATNDSTLYTMACACFKNVKGFRDADKLEAECERLATICENREKETKEIYMSALAHQNSGDIEQLKAAIIEYKSIINYEDAREKYNICIKTINDMLENAVKEINNIRKDKKCSPSFINGYISNLKKLNFDDSNGLVLVTVKGGGGMMGTADETPYVFESSGKRAKTFSGKTSNSALMILPTGKCSITTKRFSWADPECKKEASNISSVNIEVRNTMVTEVIIDRRNFRSPTFEIKCY